MLHDCILHKVTAEIIVAYVNAGWHAARTSKFHNDNPILINNY